MTFVMCCRKNRGRISYFIWFCLPWFTYFLSKNEINKNCLLPRISKHDKSTKALVLFLQLFLCCTAFFYFFSFVYVMHLNGITVVIKGSHFNRLDRESSHVKKLPGTTHQKKNNFELNNNNRTDATTHS